MINKFDGEFAFLSNFSPSLITILCQEKPIDGLTFPTVEHAYQAHKTLDFEARLVFTDPALTAAMAKKRGRKLKVREDWDQVKLAIMFKCLELKFKDRELSDKLKETFPHDLVEGNWWGDTFWGVCNGEGSNWLGTQLMIVRSKLLWWE